ncbi:MAG: LysE family translocator [Trueperaceae bacterium]|nr:MAG: LysE family translocator [Trueperaceae bacterium]
MIDPTTLTLFIAAALLLLITPGPAVLYVIARSVGQGTKAGVVSAIGLSVGITLHIVAATAGLSAILLSSALAFGAVKFLGAAYLIYLGVRGLFQQEAKGPLQMEKEPLRNIFWQGVLVNVLNPKTALFFFAFLPQFIDPVRSSVAAQVLLLGTIFVGLAAISDSAYAFLAGGVGRRIRSNATISRLQRYLSSAILIALGITAAVSNTSPINR